MHVRLPARAGEHLFERRSNFCVNVHALILTYGGARSAKLTFDAPPIYVYEVGAESKSLIAFRATRRNRPMKAGAQRL